MKGTEELSLSSLPAGMPILVTGATGGIGKEITRALVGMGFTLILGCRSEKKYKALAEAVKAENSGAKLSFLPLDLNDSQVVREAVEKLQGVQLAGVVNNAGIMCREYGLSRDGRETTLNVNYYNTRLLNELLLPQVAEGGCVVFTTSLTRFLGSRKHLAESVTEKEFGQLITYGLSKKLLTRYASTFAEAAERRGVRVNCCDPGIVDSDMITMHRWFDGLSNIFFRPFIRKTEVGARPALRALLLGVNRKIVTLHGLHKMEF